MEAGYHLAHDDYFVTYNGFGFDKIEIEYCLVVTNLFNRKKVKTVKQGGEWNWINLIGNKYKIRRQNRLILDYNDSLRSGIDEQDFVIKSGVNVNFEIDMGVVSDLTKDEEHKIFLELYRKLKREKPRKNGESEEDYKRRLNGEVNSDEFKEKYDKAVEKYKKKHFSKNGAVQKFIDQPDAIERMQLEIRKIISLVIAKSSYNQLVGGGTITVDRQPEYLEAPDKEKIRSILLDIQRKYGIRNIEIVYTDINLPQSIIDVQEQKKVSEEEIEIAENKAEAERIKMEVELEKRKREIQAVIQTVMESYRGVPLDELAPIIAALTNNNSVNIFGGKSGNGSSSLDTATILAMMKQNSNGNTNNDGQTSLFEESGPTK